METNQYSSLVGKKVRLHLKENSTQEGVVVRVGSDYLVLKGENSQVKSIQFSKVTRIEELK